MKRLFYLVPVFLAILGCHKCPQVGVIPSEWKDSNFQSYDAVKFPNVKADLDNARCPQPPLLKVPNTIAFIGDVLANNKKVNLYVTGRNSPGGGTLEAKWESLCLRFFGSNEKLAIVERAKLPLLLQEIGREQAGIMSPDESTKTLKMIGITHVLFVDSSRRGITDYLTGRLVDLETGKVLAIDEIMD